ncbi:MAG TPA: hypothetical protein VE861_09695, partial [Gemmatimonadaceae bacterium]|nr:hypothetical protein [Gemmatimonadaceae bacterium]
MRSSIRLFVLAALGATTLEAQAARPDTVADPHRWLEEMTGDRAMAWVRAENVKTANVLENDPRFAEIHAAALKMAQARDRIPYVTFINGALYNFWQDSAHVRGIWRKTSLASYRTASPTWVTVLDLDALAKKEDANWVWGGASCRRPAEDHCLISLSDGGEDARTLREFDLDTQRFVTNGFVLPKGKQNVSWMSPDTLLVAREWVPGEMTTSGYAYVVRKLGRGQSLAQAREVFRGTPRDVRVAPVSVTDAEGRRLSMILRGTSFFESEYHLVRGNEVTRMHIPQKAGVVGMLDGQVLVQLSEPWTQGATTIASGALASFDAANAMRAPMALSPVAVIEPGPRESIENVSATKDRLLVGITRNVIGQVLSFARGANGSWTRTALKLPDNVSTNIVDTDRRSNRAFIGITGYLTPSSVWLADAGTFAVSQVKSLAPRFDASRAEVQQLEATSSDGVKVPYFVVRPKEMRLDGSNPTILY